MKEELSETVLAYQQLGNQESGYTLVFLHGATMTKAGMVLFAEQFKEYNCIVFDLPAHGESQEKEPKDIKGFAKRVEYSLEALQKEGKVREKLIIMGYSMGGSITCEIALRKKIVIEGMVLLSTGANLNQYTPLVDELKKRPKQAFDSAEFFQYAFGADTTEEQKEMIIDCLNKTKVSDEIGYEDLIVANQYNRISQIKQLQIPAIIVHGNDDQIILPMSAIDLLTNLSKSELLMLPYRGHTALFEETDLIVGKVKSFIEKI